MAKSGSCFFRIGYFLYTRTRVGYYYHQRDIAKARQKFPDGSHSETHSYTAADLEILPIASLTDNYAYLVIDKESMTSVLIDPGDPEPVLKVLNERKLIPHSILITHKHWDHSGGNAELKKLYPDVRIYGGTLDNVARTTHPVSDGDVLDFGKLKFDVMFTPGHTVGHMVYLLDGKSFGAPNSLFSGDHLFLGGCGRMFECEPMKMLRSLDLIRDLDSRTLMWPGHEYAEDNLEFALHLEPENTDIREKYQWALEQRNNKQCTHPSTIDEERRYNPYLRTDGESLLTALDMFKGGDGPPTDDTRAKVLLEIRARKDQYKYKL